MRDTQPNSVANSTRSVKFANELVSTANVRNPSSWPGVQHACMKGKGKGHPRTGHEGPEGE